MKPGRLDMPPSHCSLCIVGNEIAILSQKSWQKELLLLSYSVFGETEFLCQFAVLKKHKIDKTICYWKDANLFSIFCLENVVGNAEKIYAVYEVELLHFILLHVQPCWPIFVPNHVLSSSALLFYCQSKVLGYKLQ